MYGKYWSRTRIVKLCPYLVGNRYRRTRGYSDYKSIITLHEL